MFDFLAKGGVLVGPILLCSVIALALFLERLIRLGRVKVRGNGLVAGMARFIQKGEDQQAYDLVSQDASPMGRILTQAMEVKNQDRETLEAVLVHATEAEARGLSRYLQTLATIGNITPLLGLLGTVMGMIKAFMVIQEMGGKVNAAVLAGGIWEAMLTTALGLAVALPTMVAHSYLSARVDRYEAQLQDGTVTFLKAIGFRIHGHLHTGKDHTHTHTHAHP
ncbi:biopolymer transporter ExbB [Desulfosarcina ovata subsp. sediminis]|uniref:Biopolymer transporter ExbB n=1 Tax=Desulfosarcina ovata subsp. sediminis TaxID=885957 RepID=A0A5K7ZPB7_9BACT|nr:MotA/TolQ/ExbB proton channel family protein [Desulfosarcina ovata]BBO82387.1 biopolymer transporter ExbB [Desulfosarcina ovata subsp. sediminis]